MWEKIYIRFFSGFSIVLVLYKGAELQNAVCIFYFLFPRLEEMMVLCRMEQEGMVRNSD